MYTVYADRALLYHPKMVNDGYAIYNPTLIIEDNKTGTFQFSMPITNALYNSLKKMKTIITVYDDTELIFRGRILNDERDFNNNKLVYCEGELAFLLDSIARPFDFKGTIQQLFAEIVSIHNSQVEADKQFEVGRCDILAPNEIKYSFTDYNNCWTLLNSYLIDVYGGHIRVRYEDNKRYLDYITTYGTTSTQNVVFGTNLLDITQYISAENVFTRLIPLGATYDYQLEDTEITKGVIKEAETEPVKNKAGSSSTEFVFKTVVTLNSQKKEDKKSNVKIDYYIKASKGSVSWSGLDGNKIYADIKLSGKEIKKVGLSSFSINSEYNLLASYTGDVDTGNMTITGEFVNQYTSQDNKPISTSMAVVVNTYQGKYLKYTIESVNGGKDYIEDTAAIELFGQINRVQEFPDIEEPSELLTKAREYLAENIVMSVTLEVNAVDLGLLNVNYEKFKMGDRVRVLSHPHNLDSYFSLTKVQLNLQNPENNVYSFGRAETTITETQINTQSNIQLTADQIATIVNDVNYQYTVTEQVSALVEQVYDHYADIQTVIDNLSVTYADIDFANIGTASVKNLFADKAVLTEAEIAALQAESASISQILAKGLTANTAFIDNLTASTAFIDNLTTDHLDAKYLAADFANLTQASVNSLFSKEIFTDKLSAGYVEAGFANIGAAEINTLTANTTFTQFLTSNYASLNLANVRNLNAKDFFANSGIMKDLQVSDQYVTGNLNAVYLKGDTIEANTLKADRLIVKGNDGFYYQMNVVAHEDGRISETEWTRIQNEGVKEALHGTNIIARSVTADRIAAKSISANELAVSITGEDYEQGTTLMSLKAGIEGVSSTVNNWSVGGYNMLLDTNAESVTKVNADADRYFSDSGSASYIKTSIVKINDSPFDGDIYGAEYEVIGTPSSYISRCLCWYTNANACVELIPGQMYTMSCYARVVTPGTTSTGLKLKFQYGVSPYYAVNVDISGTTWKRYSHTFEAKATYLNSSNKTRMYVAGLAIASGETAGKIQTCGFKLERGTLATDWSESPYEFEKNTNTIIEQRKDEIVLAAHSYTKIGGTNLLRNTASDWGEWITPSANTNNQSSEKSRYQVDEEDLKYFKPGNLLTFSFDIEFSGANPGTGGTGRWYYQSYANKNGTSDWNKINWDAEGLGSTLPIADGVYHYTATAEIPSTMDYTTDTTYYRVQIRTNYWNGTGKYRLRNVKLETGNTETAWSPSPADTEDRFSDVESKITAAKFNIQDDQISASVSQFIGEYLGDNNYATTDDINKATSGLVSTTKLSQTAKAITGTVSQVDKRVSKLENNDETYQTWFTFDSNALTIGKTGSPVKANLTNTALNFTDGTNILASVSSANGLVGKEVQVGDTTTDNLRWRLTTNSAGDHFRITRHQ